MVQAQYIQESLNARSAADLSVNPADHFGASIDEIDNLNGIPIRGSGNLTRESYVFQAVYSNRDEYGGIQLRARVHSYGGMPRQMRSLMQETAHRAAHMFNSAIQTSAYVNGEARGTDSGAGFLDGFNPVGVYQNWENEEIDPGEATTDPGVVDWSVEVYEEDSFDMADLAGIAQGLSYPYHVETETTPGSEAVHIPPHKWTIAGPHDSRPEYYELRPPARTEARERYREGAGRGKRVYINGKYVGETDNKGRVWLKTEYDGGDGHSYRGKYSRKGVVETDEDATYQAIRSGGVLYLTGETEGRIDLVTARAKPEGYRAVDPDNVPPHVEVREGTVGGTVRTLRLNNVNDELECECRRDEERPWALGESSPIYSHHLRRRQRWEPALGGDPNHRSWRGGGRGGDE